MARRRIRISSFTTPQALTKTRPHPRPLSHGERGACFIKTKKLSPKPQPHPRPLSHWERGACFIKNLTKTHKKAPPLQRPKPHHLMKCEKGAWRSHVPFSHFGGRGGTSSPHTKKTKALSFFATSAAHFGKWAAVATVPACTDVFLGQAADFSHVMVYQISHCKRDDKPDDEDVFIHSEPHGEWRIYHGMWTIYKCGQYI